jgi:sulfide dehydrogenase cytochrome subunit
MRAKVAEIAMKTTREMTVMTRSIGIAVVLAGLAAPASAQSDQGTRLAGACPGCHGVGGAGAAGIPAIQGTMSRAEFITAMQEFRADRRPATVMGRISRGYTDAEFAALAAIYARPEASR